MNFILFNDPTGIVGQLKDIAVSAPHSRSKRKRILCFLGISGEAADYWW